MKALIVTANSQAEKATIRTFDSITDAKKSGFTCKDRFFVGDFTGDIEIREFVGNEERITIAKNPNKYPIRVFYDGESAMISATDFETAGPRDHEFKI